MMTSVERDFEQAMYAVYEQAKNFEYYATYFRQMLDRYGGLETAKRLLRSKQTQEGLFRLWELEALDISVEAVVLRKEYRSLFSDTELAEAQRRLSDLGYTIAADDRGQDAEG